MKNEKNKTDQQLIITISKFLYFIFKDKMMSYRYLKWKYIKNPAGKSILLTEKDNKKIIGIRALVPWLFSVKGNRKKIFQFCEASTHPDHRGKHIFTNLTRKAMERSNESVFFNYPHEGNSLPAYIKSFGTKKIDEFNYIIQFSSLNYLNALFKFSKRKQFYIMNIENDEMKNVTQEEFVNNMHLFKSFTYSERNILPYRGFDFIKWRFLEHPEKKYQLLLIKRNNESIGYIVFGKRKFGRIYALTVIDIFTTKRFYKEKHILAVIKRYAKYRKEPFIFLVLLKSVIKNCKIISNFIKIPKKHINLAITDYKCKNIEFYENQDNWLLYPADTDTF